MTLYIKGTDTEVTGTLEELTGVALINKISKDGTPEYSGDTVVTWDDQKTRCWPDGSAIFVCVNGDHHHHKNVEERVDEPTNRITRYVQ